MSGVGITGKIVPLNGAPFPVFEDINGQGGWRSVADTTARDAIPALFRKIGMVVVDESTGIGYQLVGGILNANWVVQSESGAAFIIRTSLADLAARDSASLPNGCTAYVISEQENYRLDTANTFAVSSPLVVARGAGAGRWFRKSKAYVVGNFTLWCQSFGFGVAGFTVGQQGASSTAEPDILLDMSSFIDGTGNQQGVITDLLGNIWFIVNGDNFNLVGVHQFALGDCLESGTPTPILSFNPPQPGETEAAIAVFDRQNGLWIAVGGHATFGILMIERYGQRALTPGGVPGLSLSAQAAPTPSASTSNQLDMVFDGQGNLWCSCAFSGDSSTSSNGAIVMYTPDQLAAGGVGIAPTIFWRGSNFTGPGLSATAGLAIAPNGYIWAADYSNGPGTQVKAWAPTHASGNPAPDVVITATGFSGPYSLAFDTSGNLWVQNGNDNRLMRVPAAQLTASGTVTPDVTLNPTTTLTNKMTFPNNPDRVGLLPSGFLLAP